MKSHSSYERESWRDTRASESWLIHICGTLGRLLDPTKILQFWSVPSTYYLELWQFHRGWTETPSMATSIWCVLWLFHCCLHEHSSFRAMWCSHLGANKVLFLGTTVTLALFHAAQDWRGSSPVICCLFLPQHLSYLQRPAPRDSELFCCKGGIDSLLHL